MALTLPLLHLLHFFNNHLPHESKGAVEHLRGLWLCAGDGVEANEHLTDGYRYIERRRHILPPCPCTAW